MLLRRFFGVGNPISYVTRTVGGDSIAEKRKEWRYRCLICTLQIRCVCRARESGDLNLGDKSCIIASWLISSSAWNRASVHLSQDQRVTYIFLAKFYAMDDGLVVRYSGYQWLTTAVCKCLVHNGSNSRCRCAVHSAQWPRTRPCGYGSIVARQ